jgi:hypothetical protein
MTGRSNINERLPDKMVVIRCIPPSRQKKAEYA